MDDQIMRIKAKTDATNPIIEELVKERNEARADLAEAERHAITYRQELERVSGERDAMQAKVDAATHFLVKLKDHAGSKLVWTRWVVEELHKAMGIGTDNNPSSAQFAVSDDAKELVARADKEIAEKSAALVAAERKIEELADSLYQHKESHGNAVNALRSRVKMLSDVKRELLGGKLEDRTYGFKGGYKTSELDALICNYDGTAGSKDKMILDLAIHLRDVIAVCRAVLRIARGE